MKLTANIENITYNVINWCKKEFGESKYHTEELSVFLDVNPEDIAKAEFDFSDTEITLYLKNIHSIRDLIINIIHEYIHYLQPKNWYTRFFNKLEIINDRINYDEYFIHPYEFEAKCLSEQEVDRCMTDLGIENLAKNKRQNTLIN